MAKIKIIYIYNNMRDFSLSHEEVKVNEFLSKVNLISLNVHISELENSNVEKVRYTIVYDEKSV